MKPYYRFRKILWRRRLEHLRVSLQEFGSHYILRRTEHLRYVQRFVLGWLAVVIIAAVGLLNQLQALVPYYQARGPADGGTLTEGVVGPVNIINPLFPENTASEMAARLIFNALVRYNAQGKLEGDLAHEWQIDETGKIYTFRLREGISWHDGKPFTSKDVLFTFKTIQNSNVDSPLSPGWDNIRIQTNDEKTVVFTLPAPYTPFLDSLTTGILPAHLLDTAEPAQLRKVEFNQKPVGTGPFKFKSFSFQGDEVRLTANKTYFRGSPRLDGYTIRSYENSASLARAYGGNQVNNAAGLSFDEGAALKRSEAALLKLPLAAQTFIFLNNADPLLQDKAIRQALTQATDPVAIAESFNLNYRAARSPLLTEHPGYSSALTQLAPNLAQAEAILEGAGWKKDTDGVRKRAGQPLRVELVAQNTDIYPLAAAKLQEQWKQVGIDLKITLLDLAKLQQAHIQTRAYQILLYSIPLGADPDQYVYWHNSQVAAPGLNLAQYKSAAADQALEAGRTRQTTALRAAKYESFLNAWRDDAPAIALLRLNYFYALNPNFMGIKNHRLVNPSDRYANVEQWTINTQPVFKRLYSDK